MVMRLTEHSMDFVCGEHLAGRYCYTDPFKCYLHPLNTPKGYPISLRSPPDHKHHKGLMFGLRTQQVNFWEEYGTKPGELVGRQHHTGFASTVFAGDQVGFKESISWKAEDGSLLFLEHRTIHCATEAGRFTWTWISDLQAQQHLTLTISQWSIPDRHGRLVNYHGLGLRFSRDFAGTGGDELLLDGKPVSIRDALGEQPDEVQFLGSLASTMPVKKAGVSLSAQPRTGLFVMREPFAFVSLGPTVLGGYDLRAGQYIRNAYLIKVFDLE
jgi:hypothetical protein